MDITPPLEEEEEDCSSRRVYRTRRHTNASPACIIGITRKPTMLLLYTGLGLYIFSMFVVDHLFACIPPQWKLFFYSVLCTAGVVPSSSIIVFHLKHTHIHTSALNRPSQASSLSCAPSIYIWYDGLYNIFSFLLYDLLASSILDLFFFFSFLFTDGKLYTGLGSDINPCKSEWLQCWRTGWHARRLYRRRSTGRMSGYNNIISAQDCIYLNFTSSSAARR